MNGYTLNRAIKLPRREGEDAYIAGSSIEENPYGTLLCNTQAFDWHDGYTQIERKYNKLWRYLKEKDTHERLILKKSKKEYCNYLQAGMGENEIWVSLVIEHIN